MVPGRILISLGTDEEHLKIQCYQFIRFLLVVAGFDEDSDDVRYFTKTST